jgi:kynurenine formamidase
MRLARASSCRRARLVEALGQFTACEHAAILEVWVANHLALFEKGIPLIQFVTNLSQIGTNKFVLVALPLKIKGGDASPARVVALVE